MNVNVTFLRLKTSFIKDTGCRIVQLFPVLGPWIKDALQFAAECMQQLKGCECACIVGGILKNSNFKIEGSKEVVQAPAWRK